MISVLLAIYFAHCSAERNFVLETHQIILPGGPQACENDDYCFSFKNENIDELPDFEKSLDALNNIFPFSSLASANILLKNTFNTNMYLEVANPAYRDQLNSLEIRCSDNSSIKITPEENATELKSVRLYAIKETIIKQIMNKYSQCSLNSILMGYDPIKKVEVGPNETVKIEIEGNKPYIKFRTEIRERLTFLGSTLVFFIYFVLLLGASLTISAFFSNFKTRP